MYIYSIENKDALRDIIENELRALGIKPPSKTKKPTINKRSVHARARIFHRSLDQLPCQSVHLQCGAIIQVPCFLVDLCEALEHRLDTKGIFRKGGSAVRQREIKAHIEAGGPLSNEFHEIDVANILKMFLRELPEPLLPWHFHDALVKCYGRSMEHLLTACLLLPHPNFNVLAYLMQFLHRVAAASPVNLMPASNLAIVLVPAVMPVQDSVSKHMDQLHAQQLDQHVHVIQVLIEQALELGRLPANLALQLGLQEDEPMYDVVDRASFGSLDSLGPERKGRKRRSGSLTRVLNGLRKIVGGKTAASPGVEVDHHPSPLIMSAKKRKIDVAGMSTKKKQEVLLSLPEGAMLMATPARLCMTPHCDSPTAPTLIYCATPPVCSHPNPQKSPHPQLLLKSRPRSRFFTPKSRSESVLHRGAGPPSEKKQRLSFGSKKSSKKQQKQVEVVEDAPQLPKRKRSWSSLGGSWGRSMRRLAPVTGASTPLLHSPYATRFGSGLTGDGVDLSPQASPQVDYSDEYEEIKNKVSNLENQLNEELSKAALAATVDAHPASFVQGEYERTLEDSERFSNCQSTEQLAKRLSKELKIRRSGENKVIRSPSARKIGSLRRRSRELNRPLLRTSSLGKMVRSPVRSTVPPPSGRGLRRGRPNTITTGLPSPANSLLKASTQSLPADAPVVGQSAAVNKHVEFLVPQSPMTGPVEFLVPQSPMTGPVIRSVQRASSFNESTDCIRSEIKKASSIGSIIDSDGGKGTWKDANKFFASATPSKHQSLLGRPSIAEIKRNRAGMVLASVRLFDNQPSSPNIKPKCAVTDVKPVSKVKRSFEGRHISPSTVTTPMLSTPQQTGSKPHTQFTPHSDGAKPHVSRVTKANNSLPRDWLSGKENVPSPASPLRLLKSQFSPQMPLPATLKDTIYDVCTPRSMRLKSPLAVQDNNIPPTTPQQCPVIKMPLSVRPISALRRMPHVHDTPSRRPLQATPLRRSPRLLAMALRNSPSVP